MKRLLIPFIALLGLAACASGSDSSESTRPERTGAPETTVETTEAPSVSVMLTMPPECDRGDIRTVGDETQRCIDGQWKTTSVAPPVLVRVARACLLSIEASDDGKSLTLDTIGTEDFSGNSIEEVSCVLSELNAPDSIFERINHTRALDGMQSGIWDEFTAYWTYHPDDGLFLTIESAT